MSVRGAMVRVGGTRTGSYNEPGEEGSKELAAVSCSSLVSASRH